MKKYILCLSLLALCVSSKVYSADGQGDYDAGLKFYAAGDYPDAVLSFNNAVHRAPDNSAALLGRANSYYALGKYQQALSDYKKLLSIQPQNAQVAQIVQNLEAKFPSLTASPLPPRPDGDHRMEKRFGVYVGLLSDPVISYGGVSAAFNATHYLRLTGSFGYLSVPGGIEWNNVDGNGGTASSSSANLTATSLGLGLKALVPGLEFSPVAGLNLSETSFNLPPGTLFVNLSNGSQSDSTSLVFLYANLGFDYQAKDGFDLGFGVNILLTYVSGAYPGLNIGKFF